MQLLKLEVKNWVHHRQRTCEFTRGLVAILGENGSGKSSLFGAIRWLLTGENPNYGVKSDNVSQYAQPGEPAYATLDFEHNGHFASVTRHLLPEKEPSILLVDGKEVARGDRAVTAGVEKLLGVDAKFISRFIIVSQTEIFSFIDDNQTDTDKFFQRLFNTAKADKCQDVIGKSLLKISVPELPKSSGQLRRECDELQQAVAAVEAQIAPLPTLAAFLDAQAHDQQIIRDWSERQNAASALVRVETTTQQQRAQLRTAQNTLDQYVADLDAFNAALAGKDDAHRAAKIALGHWENYKNILTVKSRLQAQRDEIAAARAANPSQPPPPRPSAAELRAEIELCQQRIREVRRFIAMFDEDGVAECPTCHTPSTQLAAQVAAQRKTLDAENARLQDLQTAEAAQKEAEAAYAQWEKIDSQLTARETQLQSAEQDLTLVQPPTATEDELQQAVADYEDFAAAQNELQPMVDEVKTQIANLNAAIASQEEQRQLLEQTLRESRVTAADADLAQRRQTELQKQCATRHELEQQRVILASDLAQRQKELQTAERQERDAVRLREWSTVAEQAREALKHAPRVVAQRNLQRLETAINELLQIFGVNFLVRVASDGTPTFVAEFYDGRRQVAQRLSIGQKTVLALAFRVAVNAQFAEEIGLLALDEPTASLDAPRIQALAPVLEKLRELSTAKGLQCLLVTHAAGLSHLFESTIELEPPELRNVRTAG